MQFSNFHDHQQDIVLSVEQLGVSDKGWNVATLNLRSHLQLLAEIRCLMTQKVESSIINMDNNTTDNIIRSINMYSRKSLGPRTEA